MGRRKKFKLRETITFNNEEEFSSVIEQLPFNREPRVRPDLIISMHENKGFVSNINIIYTDLINGKWTYFCADGGNRVKTAISLGIPFYGNVMRDDFESLEEIVIYVASLNSKVKAWPPDIYVRAFCYLQFKDYLVLRKMSGKTHYTTSTVAQMLEGVRGRGATGKHIKSGKFQALLVRETERTLKLASKLSKYGKMSGRMVLAFHYVNQLSAFNEESFTEKYKEFYDCVKELKLDDYTDTFLKWIKN